MYLAEVVGTVVSTTKDERLVGFKLLLTRRLDEPADKTSAQVAIDTVGAGAGETVIVATGGAARHASGRSDCPVDAAIVAIVDTVEHEG